MVLARERVFTPMSFDFGLRYVVYHPLRVNLYRLGSYGRPYTLRIAPRQDCAKMRPHSRYYRVTRSFETRSVGSLRSAFSARPLCRSASSASLSFCRFNMALRAVVEKRSWEVIGSATTFPLTRSSVSPGSRPARHPFRITYPGL